MVSVYLWPTACVHPRCIDTLSAASQDFAHWDFEHHSPARQLQLWHGTMHRFPISAKCSLTAQPQHSFRCCSEHICPIQPDHTSPPDPHKGLIPKSRSLNEPVFTSTVQHISKLAEQTTPVPSEHTLMAACSVTCYITYHSQSHWGVCHQPLLHLNFLSTVRSFWKPSNSLLKSLQRCK